MSFPTPIYHGIVTGGAAHGPFGGLDSNTLLCIPCDGTNGGTSFTDASQYGRTITVHGSTTTDTSTVEFGSASGKFGVGTTDWIGDTGLNYSFGTGDFTVDCWVRFSSLAANTTIASDTNNAAATFNIKWNTAGPVLRTVLNGVGYNVTWSPSTSTWYHLAVVRSGTTLTAYVDGTSLGSNTSSDNIATCGLQFGQDTTGTNRQLIGWLDEIRVSNVARWTSNFTRPSVAYT